MGLMADSLKVSSELCVESVCTEDVHIVYVFTCILQMFTNISKLTVYILMIVS